MRESSLLPAPEELVSLAKRIARSRHLRSSFFSTELFSEPGWEMILALYEADSAGFRITVSNLCLASKAPDSTALRWIDKLLDLKMIRRRKNPLDARIVFIELDPDARLKVEAYLTEVWSAFYAVR